MGAVDGFGARWSSSGMRVLALLLCLASPVGAQVCAPRALPAVNSCSGRAHVSLAIVGDVLVHQALAWRGYARGFDTLWAAAVPLLQGADLAIANLEGPVAAGFARGGRRVADPGPVFDDEVYTEYPVFNYHPILIAALREAGIDIVTTANNHALDRGPAGLEATLDALDAGGMAHVGSVRGGEARWQPLRLRTPVGVVSLIGCSFSTNGLADPRGQVPGCYDDRAGLLATVRAEVARGAGVMVFPHWGQEYTLQPDAQQRSLARALVQAGAMAVIGTHPHVPQPWEMLDGPVGVVPVVYSTGNFISAQTALEQATAPLVWLDLCAGVQGPQIGGAGYLPLQMAFDGTDPLLVRPGTDPRGAAGRALLTRLIPGRDLSAVTDCTNHRAAPALRQDR